MIYTTQNTMKILKAISLSGTQPLKRSEIAEMTGINKTTCSHIISTLLSEGYVIRVSHKEGYVIGPAFYALATHISYNPRITSICNNGIRWINKQLSCTCILAVMENSQKYIIDYVDTEDNPFVHPIELFNEDLFQTATGRVLVSNLSRCSFNKVIERYGLPECIGKSKIQSADQCYEVLKKIKKEKIVKVSVKRNDIKWHNYAFGIYSNSECVAAIGIVIYSESEVVLEEQKICKILSEASEKIHRALNVATTLNE